MHQKPKDVKHETTEKAFWWSHRPDPYPTQRSRNPKSVHIGGVSLGSDTGSKTKHIVCTMHYFYFYITFTESHKTSPET